jgi:hypothetical protein
MLPETLYPRDAVVLAENESLAQIDGTAQKVMSMPRTTQLGYFVSSSWPERFKARKI